MKKFSLPPPWRLKGRGYILLYRFSEKFVQTHCVLPKDISFFGGFGSVMIVQYHYSNAGPYDELLFIPGKVELTKMVFNSIGHTISKIYVSTEISKISGRENWGIPKELAHFYWERVSSKREIIKIGVNKSIFFEIDISHQTWFFPISMDFLPFKLMQYKDNQVFITKFEGFGKATLASVKMIDVIPEYFPPVRKPLIAFYIDSFELQFPQPIIKNL